MMQIKFKSILYLVAGLLWMNFIQAQESVNSSGGTATGSGGSLTYSIGQLVYTTNADNIGSVAQGVQQPYEILISEINDFNLNLSVLLYPNPTADNIVLNIRDYSSEELSYGLYDHLGKLIFQRPISAVQTQISLNFLPAATYFIHVINEEKKSIQSFKIIKN